MLCVVRCDGEACVVLVVGEKMQGNWEGAVRSRRKKGFGSKYDLT